MAAAAVTILAFAAAACSGQQSAHSVAPTIRPLTTITPWSSAVPEGDNDVMVQYLGSTCASFDRAEVVETSTEVQVFVFERQTSAGSACSAVGRRMKVLIVLQHPLNGRTLAGCGPGSALPCLPPNGGYVPHTTVLSG